VSIQEPINTGSRELQQDGVSPAILTESRRHREVALLSDEIGLPFNGDTVTLDQYNKLMEDYLSQSRNT